jgi:prepilin-type N-terminal cleavage/methylation domain-containing protein
VRQAAGFTLVELLVVVAIATLVVGVTVSYAVPILARETLRSSTYDVQTYLQLARVEAVSRNRACRLLIDVATKELRVLDSRGTASASDDETLYRTTLPVAVGFAHPAMAQAVTLAALGPSSYQAVFEADGVVSAGSGAIVLFGGDEFRRVSVHGAGGIEIERWTGSGWAAGS